jgi:two-component system CheB/CheR fusion protein
VGASAGGLEAFSRVLEPLGADAPLALILVQHLPRDQRSLLPSLLAKSTRMVVVEGVDRLKLQPGHVYVILPNTRMSVSDGCLRVEPRSSDRAFDAPIDHLFGSLAEQYREKAIGVVLSGSGADGADGLRAIKGVGGITIAQDPHEAQTDGMPGAAIATGAVELTLAAAEIGRELERLSRHPYFREPGSAHLPDEPAPPTERDQLAPIFRLLRRASGVDFAHYKAPTIVRRIQRRMVLHHLVGFPEYAAMLESDSTELARLQDDLLINVTSFFREPESFDAIQTSVLPEIISAHEAKNHPMRVWVPGCSSGEDAYSVAIAVLEALDEKRSSVPLQVFGTDVSQKMIDRARAGIYPASIAADMTPERLDRFFLRFDGGYRVNPAVRQRCVFARQDITSDPPFSRLDLVMCRNLLIYLGETLQRKVINVFHYALNPGGVLMLGRSETVGLQTQLFTMSDARWKVYRRKPGTTDVREIDYHPRPPPEPTSLGRGRSTSSAASPGAGEWESQGEANRLLLDRFAPPTVIVSSDLRIVRSRGRTSRYLELPDGDATLDALKMVRPGLLSALRGALEDVRAHGKPVRRDGLRFHADGRTQVVSLEVTPIGRVDERHFLVMFEEGQPAVPAPKLGAGSGRPKKPVPAARSPGLEVQLQDELAATRAHLQSNIQDLEVSNEELQAANEEILSSNEELQSTNEELDTAREELQSTNEELSTVNDELQTRNADLSLANGDLVNLLSNVQIPIVMVTPDLKIRRFTPAAERLLNLISSDVGRPIKHISPNIMYPALEARIREVLDTVTAHEHEVEDQDGNTYLLRIRPYKAVDNRIDGAVLTLVDISSALKMARETGEAIMSTVRDPILLLGSDQTVKRANTAFFERFHVAREETEGKLVYSLGKGQWDIPALRRLLREILPDRKNFQDFPVEYVFPDSGRQKMLLDGRRLESGSEGASVILLIIRDALNAEDA